MDMKFGHVQVVIIFLFIIRSDQTVKGNQKMIVVCFVLVSMSGMTKMTERMTREPTPIIKRAPWTRETGERRGGWSNDL